MQEGTKRHESRNVGTCRKKHRNPRDETVRICRRTIRNMRVGTVGRY